MRTYTKIVSATPTISAGAIYAAGDAVGGKMTFADIGFSSFSGVICSVTIIDADKENAELDLVLFAADFTATANNSPFDPTDADLLNCIGYVKIAATDYVSFNDNSIATKLGVGLALQISDSNILYGQLVTRGTPTYTAVGDLTVKIGILRD